MGLRKFASEELIRAGYVSPDKRYGESKELEQLAYSNVMELIDVFCKQGHSGSSAPYILDLFTTLANYKPLSPLTGEDLEWEDVSSMCSQPKGTFFQNIRCTSVFKDTLKNKIFDVNGIVFTDSNGCSYTNGKSHTDVTFPYTPTTVYVKDYE